MSGVFLFGGLIIPAALLITVAIAIRTLWRSLTEPYPRVREPACERCRYPVAGLTGTSCPECGTSLLQTGIITRAMEMRRRGGLWPAIIAWTYLAAVVVLIATAFLGMLFVRSATTAFGGPQTWATPLTPASGLFATATLTTSFSYAPPGAGLTALTIRLDLNDGATHTFDLDPVANTYTTTDPQGATTAPAPFDKLAINSWLAAAGLPTADPRLASEADELTSVIQITQMTPYAQPSSMTLKHFTAGPPAFSGATPMIAQSNNGWAAAYAGLLAITALAWGLGVWLIVRRRRRLLSEPPPAPTPA